jgi:hypothetical protein
LLMDYTSKYPETISGGFKDLAANGLDIATSADGLFRIYSWDTWTGGTMHFFDNVYQYKAGDKVFSASSAKDTSEGGDPGAWFSNVYTLKTNDKTYYLGHGHSIFSTKDNGEAIKFFSIENNNLNDKIKLAKTSDGLSNDIGLEYDLFKIKNTEQRPIMMLLYNSDTKTISIPVLTKDGKQTDKYTLYKYNGKYFEAQK